MALLCSSFDKVCLKDDLCFVQNLTAHTQPVPKLARNFVTLYWAPKLRIKHKAAKSWSCFDFEKKRF